MPASRSPAGRAPELGARARTQESPPIRVATYRRASTDEDNQPYSLQAQQAKLDAFITSQDNMVAVADYEEYASGQGHRRPTRAAATPRGRSRRQFRHRSRPQD